MNLTSKLLFFNVCNRVVTNYQKVLPVNFSFPRCHRNNNGFRLSNMPLARNMSNAVSIQSKKRPMKKKKTSENDLGFRVTAFSTAEEYNLECLTKELLQQTSFEPREINADSTNLIDAVHAIRNDGSDPKSESKELFFFRKGSVVMWNLDSSETSKILQFLKQYEDNRFPDELINHESEIMSYAYSPDSVRTTIVSDRVVFSKNEELNLEKYTISNAMALSVHLGTFEEYLQKYIDSMEPVTEDLKSGNVKRMSRKEVLQKAGELFALRHNINLSSDLLDTPDFYWDREKLENLYQMTSNYFCINKRTKVMNEKINHCIELVHLLSSHLSDNHHVRLEWMIIILIMVEVGFEVLHFIN